MSRDPVIEKLRSLPDPPLPYAVWQRLNQRRARHMALRRGGVALGIVLAGGLAFLGIPPQEGEEPVPAQVAAVVDAVPIASLSTIDRALQAAYARGASDDEVAPLWEARKRLALSGIPSPTRS